MRGNHVEIARNLVNRAQKIQILHFSRSWSCTPLKGPGVPSCCERSVLIWVKGHKRAGSSSSVSSLLYSCTGVTDVAVVMPLKTYAVVIFLNEKL
jgi:hypothetical protein